MPLLPNGSFKLEGATEEPLKVGEKALGFTLNNPDGKPVSLSDFAGRPVILLLAGLTTNDLTRERLERLARLAPTISPVATPIVLLNDYHGRAKLLLEEIGNPPLQVLDAQADASAAIATYEQPTDTGSDYPLYYLDATHTITDIKSGDDFLAQDEDELNREITAKLGIASRPTPPNRPPASTTVA